MFLAVSGLCQATPISVQPATSDWIAMGAANGNPMDYVWDLQTGQPEGDIVGDAQNPGFYIQFDNHGTLLSTDGTLYFRVRLGGGLNISPTTTTITAPSNQVVYPETAAHYDSFALPFAGIANEMRRLAGIGIDDRTPLRLVIATATQTNSLNQNLGGINGGTKSSLAWDVIGAQL